MREMKFLIVGRKSSRLNGLADIVRSASSGTEVVTAASAEDALALPTLDFDVVFLDAGLGGKSRTLKGTGGESRRMDAPALARRLKSLSRNTHVIFVAEEARTGKCYQDALSVHADACLVEPISVKDVQQELDYLSYSYPAPLSPRKVFIQTFGAFNVMIDGTALAFQRTKAKELLAILVDRRGVDLKSRDGCAILFEDKPYNEKRAYYHVVITSMVRTLEKVGLKHIVVRNTRSLAIDPSAFECDAYRYLKNDPAVMQQYRGDYMAGYTWAQRSSNTLKGTGLFVQS